jgi:GntR family transcriptional regulator
VAFERAGAVIGGAEGGKPRRGGRAAGLLPLYHQVYMDLRDRLANRRDPDDAPLPSEPDLAKRYGVSRVTIRTTLARLERDGLVRRVRGVGTFPARFRADDGPADIQGHLENLLSFEEATTLHNLEWSHDVPPEPAAARALGPEPCLRIVRVRSYRDRPASFTTIHVPYPHGRLLPEPGPAATPIIRRLEQQGLIATSAEQTLTAMAAGDSAARHLDVAPGAPLIAMRRLMLDAARRPLLHQESLYVPDRFEYRMQLSRTVVGPTAKWTPVG